MSDSLWPHGLQHARLPRPWLFPRVCSNWCPLGWWYNPTILSSSVPILLLPSKSFPALGSFPVSQLFTSGGQSIGASASVLPLIFLITGLISFWIDWFDLLAVQETLKSLLQQHNLKASVLTHSDFSMVQLSHLYMITGKTIAYTVKFCVFTKMVFCALCLFVLGLEYFKEEQKQKLSLTKELSFFKSCYHILL